MFLSPQAAPLPGSLTAQVSCNTLFSQHGAAAWGLAGEADWAPHLGALKPTYGTVRKTLAGSAFGLHVLSRSRSRSLVIFDENESCQSLNLTSLRYSMIYEAIWGLSKNTAPIYSTASMESKLCEETLL